MSFRKDKARAMILPDMLPFTACSKRARSSPPSKPANNPPPAAPPVRAPVAPPPPPNAPISADNGSPTTTGPPPLRLLLLQSVPPPPTAASTGSDEDEDGGRGGAGEDGLQVSRILSTMSRMIGWPARQLAGPIGVCWGAQRRHKRRGRGCSALGVSAAVYR